MKHLLVLLSILLLLIGIACSFIGSREQLTEEDRIATSVAGTVAAQTNQNIEPTDTPVPVIPTPLPTVTPTPTQNLTVLPTATQNPTVPPTATLPATETPSILAIGDTIDNGFNALTLDNANIGESYIDDNGRNQEARNGYTFVYLDFSFKTIKSTLGRFEKIRVNLRDKDGDTYYCRVDGISFSAFPPGYGGSFRGDCEMPITVASSLDELQLEITEFGDVTHTFLLDKQSESPREIIVEKENEKHFLMGDKFLFTITCGTQHKAEYVLMNPRWSAMGSHENLKKLVLDMQITNQGKSAYAMVPEARHIYYYHYQGNTTSMEMLHRIAGIAAYEGPTAPVPGETVIKTIDFVLEQIPEVVPILFEGIEDCLIQIEDYTVTEEDYFVLEVNTSGIVASPESVGAVDETVSSSTDAPASPSCSNEPRGEFHNLWMKYQGQLGCPLQIEPLTGDFVEQPFEGGHMFWVAQIDLAFITFGGDQGDWTLYQIKWVDNGSPESCNVQVPAGKIQPIRGFGWIWCREQEIQNRLGWALDTERGFSAGVDLIQGFENGIIFRDSDGKTQGKAYVMFGKDKGTFVKEQY